MVDAVLAQAGAYAAVLHYLKAVTAALNGDTSGNKVVAKMKELPTGDRLFGKGTIRVDGRKMHPIYLLEVKAPGQAEGPWDYFKVTYTIAAGEGLPSAQGRRLPPGAVTGGPPSPASRAPVAQFYQSWNTRLLLVGLVMNARLVRTSLMKAPKAKPPDKAAKPKKSELRREAILKHALALFDMHGFANTSLDDIARETGVKREAIYYYFKDRAEILLCIIRPQTHALVDGLGAVVKSDADSTTKLYEAIRNHLQRFDRHCLEMTISLRDVYLDDAKEVRREMDKVWRQYESMWTQIVAEGQASGEFAQVGDPKMVAFAILGMCNWLARWYDPRKSVSVEELIETYFSMLAYGLVAKGNVETIRPSGLAGKRSKPPERPRLAIARRAGTASR